MCNHDFRDDMCVTCLEEEISRLKDLAADAEAGAKENAALLELSYRKRDSLTRERDEARAQKEKRNEEA